MYPLITPPFSPIQRMCEFGHGGLNLSLSLVRRDDGWDILESIWHWVSLVNKK